MPNRPNIVFIMADDLGFADVSCYGRREYATPNIDRIAERGVRFTQAYANSAVCSATRLALITGRYQYRLPLGLEEPLAGKTHIGLPPQHPTLPSQLRACGYSTALIGKWHLGVLPSFGPLKSGYDRFWGIRSGAIDYFTHLNSRGAPDLWDGDATVEQTGYLTDLLGDRAVDVVNGAAVDKKPFLLSLHFNAPHWPWVAHGDEIESERLRGGNLRHYDGGTMRTYARMVQAMDTQIGRVLQALDVNGQTENTIVVFTSDNGGERFSDTWPFSGVKTELLEGGLRVPALMCWPARLAAGTTCEQVMATMDWLPTLLDAAGTEPDAAFPSDGIGLMPMLTGGPVTTRTLFWRYKANEQAAMRDGNYKYLKLRNNTFLFDVVQDPRERANLKARLPDVYARMTAAWEAWNATMLPVIPDSFAELFTAADLADHIGT